ncbi:hypothetical protein Pmani_019304 [Petrolisthes manimaculis]|uniref:Uncharacterized protein n=1 Tax=Petrolisthes manimaculis TaxID=1843537 RepID=A0AAE1PHZ6_9EUCA|nr:hypothetical protein Pmani_019304 [Petrolisthes manimaculis]
MLPVLLLPRPHGVYWVCGLGWVCSRKPRRMLALNFLPFFKDSVDEIETGGENRDGSVLPETSQSVARLPSVSSPLPGPSGVRPPTPQLVTSVRHSRGRKRRTKAKASSLKKTHRHRRSAPLPPVPHQASSAPCAASGSGLGGVVEGWRTSTPPPEPVPPMRGGEEDAVPFYKARTIATPTPSSSKVSTVTTLDAMGFLVDIDKLNSSEAWKVDRSSDTPKIFLSSDAFFPADRGEGDLDITSPPVRSRKPTPRCRTCVYGGHASFDV